VSVSSPPTPDLPVLALDGSRVTEFASFVEEANRSVFPGYAESVGRPWSGNLDAFNDILRGGMGTPDGGFVFRLKDTANIRKALGYAETTRWLEETLERCHPTNRESVAARIELARRNDGETLFDVIVEIIRVHGPGGREPEGSVVLELDD
jgi:hypothetical protein